MGYGGGFAASMNSLPLEGKMRFKQTIYDSTRAPLARFPFPMRERLRKNDASRRFL